MNARLASLAAVVTLILGGCSTTSDSDGSYSDPAPNPVAHKERSSTGSLGPSKGGFGRPPTAAELLGTWKPVVLLGRNVANIQQMNGNRPTITFDRRLNALTWTAYDGCNWFDGRAHLRESGAFSAKARSTTTRACIGRGADLHVANFEVITAASRLDQRAGWLRFYSASGELLAEYRATHPGL